MIVILLALVTPVKAAEMEFIAPTVPDSGKELLPEEPETFSEGLWTVIKGAGELIQPALTEAAGVCAQIMVVILLLSLLKNIPGATTRPIHLAGALMIGMLLLNASHSMIRLSRDTVTELSSYGKMLLPVMTAAVAAQGGVSTSAALYTGTAFFDAVLSNLISSVLIPMVYVYLGLAVANSALGEGVLEKLSGFVKGATVWCLKTVLYVFTGYMSITGVISGSADATAVKATKITISGMVPVVGGILSDASEAILVSAGVMKSAAGVYGVLAIVALCLGPFIKIGMQYLLLKLTVACCEIFGDKETVGIVKDFTTAMGILLGMTGAVCLMLLISTVCFMRGMS